MSETGEGAGIAASEPDTTGPRLSMLECQLSDLVRSQREAEERRAMNTVALVAVYAGILVGFWAARRIYAG